MEKKIRRKRNRYPRCRKGMGKVEPGVDDAI